MIDSWLKCLCYRPSDYCGVRRGSGAVFEGDPTIYTNNAYLMSADVLQQVASDALAGSCLKLPGDDYCIGRSATTVGAAVLIADSRWHMTMRGAPPCASVATGRLKIQT
jgi:hypothetical protein